MISKEYTGNPSDYQWRLKGTNDEWVTLLGRPTWQHNMEYRRT